MEVVKGIRTITRQSREASATKLDTFAEQITTVWQIEVTVILATSVLLVAVTLGDVCANVATLVIIVS